MDKSKTSINKKVPEAAPEKVPEQPEPKQFKEDFSLFSVEQMEIINTEADPIKYVCSGGESNYRGVTKRADFESSKLMANAEFHVNSFCFIKDTFPSFPNEVVCKLGNILADLIAPVENPTNSDIDFIQLSKDKLVQFKENLAKYKLMPRSKDDFEKANDEKKELSADGKFFLNSKEINKIISYIKTDYQPYIHIWYYFNTHTRDIENKKVEIIINKPIPSLGLSFAVEQKPETTKDENENVDLDANKANEAEKQEDAAKEESKDKEQVEEKEETYLDILNRLGGNEETKKIIIEKVEKLNQDVEVKIDGRQKSGENKVKEIEDTVKGKKK